MKARALAALFSLFALVGCVFGALQAPTNPHIPEAAPVLVEQVVNSGKVKGTIATLKLEGKIEQETADAVIHTLSTLPPDLQAVVLVIDSPGGDVAAARRIVRALEELPALACVVDGDALSAGFYILQSCPLRLMTLRSTLMVHKGHISLPPGVTLAPEDQAALDAWNRALSEQVCGRMNMAKEDCVAKYEAEDWWMNWREGLAMGAVDDIVQNPREVTLGLADIIGQR